FNVLANDSDADGDPLQITATGLAGGGTVVLNPDNTYTYTPAPNFNGSDQFTYTIDDGHGGTAAGVVLLTVNPVNDVPVAVEDTFPTDGAPPVTFNVLSNASDADGDALQVSVLQPPTFGTLATLTPPVSGTYTYTPAANLNGVDRFFYTIDDGHGGTA